MTAPREEQVREALEHLQRIARNTFTGGIAASVVEKHACAALSALDGEGRQEEDEWTPTLERATPEQVRKLNELLALPWRESDIQIYDDEDEDEDEASGGAGEAPAGLTRERIAWLEGVKDAAIGVANADDWRSGAEWDEALAGLVEALARHREPERTDEH